MTRYAWTTILDRALHLHAQEVTTVGIPPILRRLHYLLVSDAEAVAAGYVNTTTVYKALSHHTARAREAGWFPDLSETTRTVSRPVGSLDMPNVSASIWHWSRNHTLRRDVELPVSIVLVAEKDGIRPLLDSRYSWLPISAVKGYSSLTLVDRLADLQDDDRETVCLYIGDYDPSGLDITRNLDDRLPFRVHRVALTWEQVQQYDLPPALAKDTDSRTAGMFAAEGRAVQVEIDALPSTALFEVLDAAISDVTAIEIRADGRPDLPDVDERERDERARLREIAELVDQALDAEDQPIDPEVS